jgi:putative transport protein
VGIATWFAATLRQYLEIAIFLALALGYYFGKFTFRGIGLGSVTATLLAGVMIGQLGMFIRSISLFVWLRTTELSC